MKNRHYLLSSNTLMVCETIDINLLLIKKKMVVVKQENCRYITGIKSEKVWLIINTMTFSPTQPPKLTTSVVPPTRLCTTVKWTAETTTTTPMAAGMESWTLKWLYSSSSLPSITFSLTGTMQRDTCAPLKASWATVTVNATTSGKS